MFRFKLRTLLILLAVVPPVLAIAYMIWGEHRVVLRHQFMPGYQEFLIAAVLIFILFGHKLPSLVRSLGRGPWD